MVIIVMYLFHLYSSFQVNLKRITNLKTVKGVEIFIILNLYQDLLKLFFSFLYLSNKVIFVFGSEHLGAPPRRRVSPAWQRFNFTVLKKPLSFPLQGFNPDALPTVFKSQHSHFDVLALQEIHDNNMDYQDTCSVLLRPLRSGRGCCTDNQASGWGSII